MADDLRDLSTEIRKLRKKLRQIENLEILGRELTEEELVKVSKKKELRSTLQKVLSKRDKLQKKLANVQRLEEKQSLSLTEKHLSAAESDTKDKKTATIITSNTEMPAGTTSVIKVSSDMCPSNELLRTIASSSGHEPETVSPLTSSAVTPSQINPVQVTTAESSNAKTKRQPSSKSTLQQKWEGSKFFVRTLEGHNDLVCSVDCWRSTLISGSRDTMLKLWDADTGQEIRSMGGHTGSVTSVRLISHPGKENGDGKITKHGLAVTGSKDCSIRVWALDEGQMKKSIYAYSPVECLDYESGVIATGSEGGKVELWNLETGENVRSVRAHDSPVTSIKFQKGRLVSGSSSGIVKIWDVRDGSLHSVMTSENDFKKVADESHIKNRPIRCLATKGDKVYWGDDGVNVKVLDVKLGKICKLRNHITDFGSTTAMATASSLFISAGYDIDRGNGYMNVRSIPDEEYIATIDDESTGCVTCLACTESDNDGVTFCRWCTGGNELKVWDQLPFGKLKKRTRSETEDSGFITTKHLRRYSSPMSHSDTDSSADDSDAPNHHDSDDDDEFESQASGGSWCVIS